MRSYLYHRRSRRPRPLFLDDDSGVFFGDLVTTAVGLSTDQLVETGAVGAFVYQQFGFLVMIPVKSALLAAAYLSWRSVPHPHNIGIPLGLAVLGVLATVWNVSMILKYV